MSPTTEMHSIDRLSRLYNLLDEPEHAVLARLTKLVEHLFHVPVAYIALLGPDLEVVTRIGSGKEHWDNLKTYPLASVLDKPTAWHDASGSPVPGFLSGDLRFAAAAALRSSSGLDLGLLVIADVKPRPEFSGSDHQTLQELAGVLAIKMELRAMACQAQESAWLVREAESRFRNIANSAPVMIIFSGVDGGSSFVNKIWLEFTGRTFSEELGDGFADTFHPDFRDRVVSIYWEAFNERKPLTVQLPMRRHDGEYCWMEFRGRPRFLDDGQYAGYIGCFIDFIDPRIAMPDSRPRRPST